MVVFDKRFIDVDFRAEANQRGLLLGDLGPHGPRLHKRLCATTWEDRYGVVPRSEWESISREQQEKKTGLEWLVTRIYNQKSEGSCVANACSQSNEIIQAKQFGRDRVIHLSAMSLYKRIGRSPGSGAMVSDGLEEMVEAGVLPLDNDENKKRFGSAVMPNTGWSTPYPENWQATAKFFKVVEYSTIQSYEGLVSALLEGFPVVVGRQGHSICYVGIIFKDGRMYFLYANSWGDWGTSAGDHRAGFGLDSEGQGRMSSGWAFATRSVVVASLPQG